jgi:hypothetical protein
MTVVPVVLTLAIFILIDYAWSRKSVMVNEPKTIRSFSPIPKAQTECVPGIRLPGNIRYHPGHTCALRESPTLVRVGIDDLVAHLGLGNQPGVYDVVLTRDGTKYSAASGTMELENRKPVHRVKLDLT